MTTITISGAAIQRYKIGYRSDEWGVRSSTPSGIPDASGSWVRYEDHAAEFQRLHACYQELEAQVIRDCMSTQQGAADGFFLLLPQRPKPEAPAGTAGLDWDAYSGAQMLAFGRDCSDAAIAALRTQQPAPAGASYEKALEEALRERDDADDFIDALLDEVLGTDRAEWSSAYGRADALEEVRERITALHKPAVDRAWKQFEAATQQAEVRPVTPYTCPKCHALWLHWPAEQTGFGRDTLNCRSADHCHYCEKAGVEQLQRLERIPAALHAPQPSPSAAVALSDDLRDRLVAISEAIADQDDRAAQAMLREILKAPQPSPSAQGDALAADHTEHPLEMVGRWYMVTQDGAATLCVDREDAEAEARKADREWPRNGPHRAVRLVESPQFGDFFRLKGQRMVLCSLLRECLPVIEALLKLPGDDDSEAHLNGLLARVGDALVAVAEDQVKRGES
ncbi:MAG TPA: hypothetical protein DET46_06515 [Comamonadaceae bacterium]|nr:MAG: hypothetical protein A3F76_07570 [Burkholderiales bacterium RIFCSPLOWO2_12_FULL_65_40]HCE28450.1 hypothetical protein [Comamonadaceae bacterium]